MNYKEMYMSNKKTYEVQDVVRNYHLQSYLNKPEQNIFNIVKKQFKSMKMLDIGVGGGRTTIHFANLANEYIGIDYSKEMINSCKKRFSNHNANNMSFKVCDVRDMAIFNDNYFDFILFSFNGIDYMSHEDRLTALREIKRVSKDGGLFCFSTHNLQNIDELFGIKLSANPLKMLRRIVKFILLKVLNEKPNKIKNTSFSVINDGAHRFRLTTYWDQFLLGHSNHFLLIRNIF